MYNFNKSEKDLVFINSLALEKLALADAVLGKIELFVMNEETDTPYPLRKGQIQSIKCAHPEKVTVTLREPNKMKTGKDWLGHTQKIGTSDLLIEKESLQNLKDNKNERYSTDTVCNNVKKMFLCMLIEHYDFDPEGKRNTATGGKSGSLKALLEFHGIPMDEDTIRGSTQSVSNEFPEIRKKQRK